jgi:glyoxylase-like metal-dependent hydrolase (beta-lactamase superfamily II)
MWKKAFAVLALLAWFAGTSSAQDATKVVNDVAQNIGATNLNSIQYSGSGFAYNIGQNPTPYVRYPKFYAQYTRVVDYGKGLSREEIIRTQFENPPHGGGGQPLYREARGVAVTSEDSPWGGGALALTPHGWVKAAMATMPTIKPATVGGKTGTVISFMMRGIYRVEGYVNGQNLLEKVDTWAPNPILGDTQIETTFSDYRDFGGVKFPMRIVQTFGDYPVLELTVKQVEPNAAVPEIRVPPPSQPTHVEAQKIADGVWYLAGHPDPNSMAIEFKDYTVIIESSVTEARALANMAEVRRLVPNKPIRYHINSHHHSDHAAGLRAYVAAGVTIITNETNKQFYEQQVLKNSHALEPDMLSRNPAPAKFIWVKDKYVLTDGDRTLEIYHVQNGHSENLLMDYLPKEKILFITDIFNQFGMPRPNDPPPGIVSPYYAALGNRIKELKLDVQQIAPSHGSKVVSADLLWKALEGKVEAPPVVPPKED